MRNHDDRRRAERARGTAALAAALVCLWAASPAHADLTLDLVWISTSGLGTLGTDTIHARPGDRLTLEIAIIVDAAGVEAYAFSVEFDGDFQDELDLFGTVVEFNNVPTARCTPFPGCFSQAEMINFNVGVEEETESTDSVAGLVGSFEAFEPKTVEGDGPASLRFPIGEITFLVTDNVARDGFDIEAGVFTGFDGYVDNNLDVDVGLTPGFAPEPGAGLLSLAALLTLGLLRRRVSRA